MAMKDIVRRIGEDARAEKDRILEEGKAEAQRIRAGHQMEADARMEELRAQAGKERKSMSDMMISTARSGASREILEEKEKFIDEVMSSALTGLGALSDSDYGSLVRKLYQNGRELTGENCRAIPCTSRDEKALKDAGISGVSPLESAARPGTGGVIVESLDGKIRVDNSFEAIMERKRLSLKVQVSRILFAED